ncbi:MAG TPA: hypothetical protein VHK69_17390 [Chitinophagaceae bacterium]|jgi:hypothetical protein|nr:hypothetical protein [Chitinophagaceae bacterium]
MQERNTTPLPRRLSRPLFIGLCLCLLAAGCRKTGIQGAEPLNAEFYPISLPEENYPFLLRLENASTGATSYEWEWGEGHRSTDESPRISRTNSAPLRVKLIARNGNRSDSTTRYIRMPYRARSVALVYLIPADMHFDKTLYEDLNNAARSIRDWYTSQMNGLRFRLNDPVVDTLSSKRESSWFLQNHPAFQDGSPVWYQNGRGEVFNQLDRSLYPTTNQVILLFLPVSSENGTVSFGGFSFVFGRFAAFSREAIGLLSHPDAFTRRRGLHLVAHELGHALGLAQNNYYRSLLYDPGTGAAPIGSGPPSLFPDCVLMPVEKATLKESGFFD